MSVIPQFVRLCAIVPGFLMLATAHAQNPVSELEAPTVEVVGTTPLPGLGTPVEDVPANVQIRTGKQIEEQKTTNIGDFLERNLGSVTVNNGQNNPFQPDLSFRGLTASPLLGTPQGLSVFMDGVRINEPFGDAVNWDLIPQNAISTINLIPGSNPVFGLNTLGGALSINTKSGFQYPGGSVTAYGGSWGRKVGQLEYGGHGEKNDWYIAGTLFDEDGWRDYSSSEVRQLFAKWGREEAETDFDVSVMIADNDLSGTQALPVSFLYDRAQAYTWPDNNKNKLFFVNAKGSHFLSDTRFITGNVYLRDYENTNFSSNVNDDYENGSNNNCVNLNPDPDAPPCSAINDQSTTETTGYGGGLQMTFLNPLAGKDNSLTLGVSADLGDTRFQQEEQNAIFTDARGTLAQGDFELETDVDATNAYYGLFFTDTMRLNDITTLTLAGRYNYAKIEIEDRTGLEPQLNGSHTFKRFNPAIGLNVNPSSSLTTYASYSEGMRAPTPIELTCADPNAPCRLPNSFLADPPLDEVVSKTFEVGARGEIAQDWGWNAAIYNIDLSNDIQFISAGGAGINAGYFDNVGDTRRQGFELGGSYSAGSLRVLANYSYVNATYESSFAINSPNNSSADVNGDIQVNPGDQIPGIPEHAFKLRADYAFLQKWSVGGTVNYFGSQYMRGDENNQSDAGQVPSYTLVNLDARYQATQALQIFLKVQNVFDEEYETLGVLGENFFVNGTFDSSNAQSEPFLSVGSPRAAWVGVTYAFGK
ncbi:MAG: TonB-dependent receptor [Burkholderiales bacterium]